MQIQQLRPKTRLQREKRVGRGDKTAGRGTKGQKARAGAKIRPAIRDILKKLPKRRGYRFRSFQGPRAVIDLAAVARHFESGAVVTPQALLERKLIRRMKGRIPPVKILGARPLEKKLTVRGIFLSRRARALIQAAGGTVSG